MNFDKFYKTEKIDLLIFDEISKFKNDYETRVKYLSLQEAVVQLKPKRQWLADTYYLLKHCDTSEYNDNHFYLSRWFCFTFAPLSTLVREIDFFILDETLPEPDIKYEDWINDALHLLRKNWGKPENFQIKNFEAWALYDAEEKPLKNLKPVKGSCFEEAERIASNWCFLRKHGDKWEQDWRKLTHIYNAFAAHYEPIATALDEKLIRKYPELKRWSKDWVREIPDKENWENGLTLCRLHKSVPKILIKEMSDGSERHCSDTEFVEYLRSEETKSYSNLTPKITFTESMTNTKLAILEAGYASIRQIERPVERRLALQDLQKEMKVSSNEFLKLIQELTIEASTTNENLGTFDQVMEADIDQEVLVDRLIMSGTVSMVASEVGTGKSTFFYQIMEAVSTGSPLFGKLNVKRGKVLVIQVDETFINAKTKFKAMELKPDSNNVRFKWEWSPSQMPELEELIKSNKYDLVLMDSFGKLFGEAAGDLVSAEAGFFMYEINSIAAKTGAAFFITHHLKKEQGKNNRKNDAPRIPTLGDFFGSGYITAGVRDAWGLWQKGEDIDGTPMFGLKYLKDNSGLMEKGWVLNLDGCLESKRHTLSGGAGGLEDIDNRANIRAKLHLLLKTASPEWLSSHKLLDQLTRCGFKSVQVSPKSVKRELLNLVNDAAKTGIERRTVRTEGRGRPKFEYRFIR